VGLWLHRRAGNSPLLHPVAIGTFAVAAALGLLAWTGHPFAAAYLDNNQILVEALFLGVVAFALPLIDNARRLFRDLAGILLCAVLSGFALGVITLLVPLLFGFSGPEIAALSLRTVSQPIAVAIAAANGLSIEIVMLSVFVTGVAVIIAGERLLSAAGVKDERHVGPALGMTSHTFGVVRALEISPLCAAYAMIGMLVVGLVYAFLLPLFLLLL
jgi:putative effector of murein hydrolase